MSKSKTPIDLVPEFRRLEEFPDYVILRDRLAELRERHAEAVADADDAEDRGRLQLRRRAKVAALVAGTEPPDDLSMDDVRRDLRAKREMSSVLSDAVAECQAELDRLTGRLAYECLQPLRDWYAQWTVAVAKAGCEFMRLSAIERDLLVALAEAGLSHAPLTDSPRRPFFLGTPQDDHSPLAVWLRELIGGSRNAIEGDEAWLAGTGLSPSDQVIQRRASQAGYR